MEIYRYFLIGAIMFCGLVLMTRWQEFSAVEVDQSGPSSSLSSTSSAAAPMTVPEFEDSATTVVAGTQSSTAQLGAEDSEGLEGLEDTIPGASVDTSIPLVEEQASQAELITVQTDSLDIRIDPLGGDIVYVALPKHRAKLENPEPFILMNRNRSMTYVSQSGLVGPNATDKAGQRPVFSSAKTEYVMADGADELTVTLSYTGQEGADVLKHYHFSRNSYLVNVEYQINNRTDQPWRAALFAQIKRDNSADPGSNSGGLGMANYLGFATTSVDEPYIKLSFDDIRDSAYKLEQTGGWLSMVQHYFISAWVPPRDQKTTFSSAVTKSGFNIMRMTSPLLNVAPQSNGSISAQFYAGPKDQYVLEEISPGLDLTVDYGWLWWIAQPLFWVLTWIQGFVSNWGWSIVVLTLFIKLAFFQLSAASYKSMAKMRVVAPKLAALKDRYGDDKQKYSQAMMELYKKEKINPLGSCLPMLIQMPVFIALYWTLMESVELRHAPFMGWITDLSAMDPFFVLPILMGLSMWFMQKLNPPPPDPMQAKIFQWMPVVMTFLFLFFPAGLVLYWLTNNLLSMAQQWVITRQIEKAAAAKA
ncbi:MAG: membrane protein insertase YidC [Pseudomonadota bacterium]